MTDKEEAAYLRGEQATYREMLSGALRGLHREVLPNTPEALRLRVAQLEAQRASTVAALRSVCGDFGDNDWEDTDHLADVVNKHLGRHLHGDDARTEERKLWMQCVVDRDGISEEQRAAFARFGVDLDAL